MSRAESVKVLRSLPNGASSVWGSYLVTLLAPRIWKWLLEFCGICGPQLFQRSFKLRYKMLFILRKIQSSFKCIVYGSVHRKYISLYIQQDATLHSLFISGNCSTCFEWYLHPSSGAHTTVSTESGICQVIQQDATLHSFLYLETALHVSGGTSTHHQERIQLYLQHLVFVRLLSAAIAAGSSNGLTNTRCCRYSCMSS